MEAILKFIKKFYETLTYLFVPGVLAPVLTNGSSEAPKAEAKAKEEAKAEAKAKEEARAEAKVKEEARAEAKTKEEARAEKNTIGLSDYKSIKEITYRVNFDVNRLKLDYIYYPTVLIPKRGTIIKPPQPGRNGNIGSSEKLFLSYVKNYFGKSLHVSNEMCLFTKDKSIPYEPDITMWNVIQGRLICIDVEIDEPYAGATGEPTHCIGYDIERNKDFLNRGWIVIRFSEEQVVEYPEKCCRVIAKVLYDLIPNYKAPKSLLQLKALNKQAYWDEEKSGQLAKAETRERLLNKRDGFKHVPVNDIATQLIDQFIKQERLVHDQYQEFDDLIKRKRSSGTGSYNASKRQPSFSNRNTTDTISSERNQKKESVNSNNNNDPDIKKSEPVQRSPIKATTKRNSSQSGIAEPTKSKIEDLSTSIKNIHDKKSGISMTGSVIPGGKIVKRTRHYGGNFDNPDFRFMERKNNPLSYALVQKLSIEQDYNFLKCSITDDKLICKGKVKPGNCSEYELKIVCEENCTPRVFITKPFIEADVKIHMYDDSSLCLFYPNDLKWKNNMNVSDYFIPWAIEWIHCYELYQLTGEWKHEEAPGHINLKNK